MPTEGWEGDIGNHDWGGFVSAQSPDPASGLLSQEASIRAAEDSHLSVRIDLGGGTASVTSAAVASVDSRLTSVEHVLSSRIDAASGGGSVTSTEVAALVQIASAAATSADQHANTVSARVVSASAELASLVQIASAAATSADSHANTASAAATSADNHANTVSARVVSVSAELASLVQIVSVNVVSVEAHVNAVSAAGAFANAHADIVSARLVSVSAELNSLLNSVEGRLSTRIDAVSGGTGSVTSQEVSVLVQVASAAATSADAHANTVSARLVSASAELVSLVQIASAAATSADGHANTASAAATSADGHANTVSGRVVSVSAELVSLLASAINTVSTRQTGNYPFGIQVSAGIATGKLPGYWTCPYNGTIRAWNLTVDTGTITVKIRKKTTGTAAPLSADWINTNGIAISANTNIRSSTLTDFTSTGVSIGDVFACDVVAVSGGTTDFAGSLEIVKT